MVGHATTPAGSRRQRGEPAWEIARLFPDQGFWTEAEFLHYFTHKRRVEYIDGFVEVLPVPTVAHQLLMQFLYEVITAFVRPRQLGLVIVSGLRVKLEPPGSKQYREPDLTFMRRDKLVGIGNDYWVGADLVVEVVSDDDPKRDLVEKRREYARAGIPEYWIVDPRDESLLILKLRGETYDEHLHGQRGDSASSVLLHGLTIDVNDLFDAARLPDANP